MYDFDEIVIFSERSSIVDIWIASLYLKKKRIVNQCVILEKINVL